MSKLKSIFAISLLASLLLLIAAVSYAAVEINFFNANWQANKASLKWQTGSETDIAGFYVWRSATNLTIGTDGKIDTTQATKLTTDAILNPSGQNCSASGNADYEYSDNVTGATVTTYYYYLEARKCVGNNTEFYGDGNTGGLQVEQSDVMIYLPAVLRN